MTDFGGILKRLSLDFPSKVPLSRRFNAIIPHEVDKVSKDDLKALSSDEVHLRDVFFVSIWMMIGF